MVDGILGKASNTLHNPGPVQSALEKKEMIHGGWNTHYDPGPIEYAMEEKRWPYSVGIVLLPATISKGSVLTKLFKGLFNKVGYTNFAKFRLQSMSSKIERAFEKINEPCFYLHFANSNFNVIYTNFFFIFSIFLFHILNIH